MGGIHFHCVPAGDEASGETWMPRYDDMLGDAVKEIEAIESTRAAAIGQPVVVRVDGASFSKFTRGFDRPFDSRIAEAMEAAAKAGVDDFHCRLAYTQSDEISFLLWHPENELPFGGRMQKLASRFAAKATAAFLLKGLELFPEAIARQTPEFDGRATAFPSLDVAAKAILWREIDARKNAVSMAARAHFPAAKLHGRSSSDMRAMLAEAGTDFYAYPERFRRGVFFRRMTVERMLEPEELARIPEAHRPTGPVKRSAVAAVKLPALSTIDNLADVLFHGAEPRVEERPLATAVYS